MLAKYIIQEIGECYMEVRDSEPPDRVRERVRENLLRLPVS